MSKTVLNHRELGKSILISVSHKIPREVKMNRSGKGLVVTSSVLWYTDGEFNLYSHLGKQFSFT